MYASETMVSVDRSKAEIEAILRRYGADQFLSGWKGGQVMIGFRLHNRMVRFILPIPPLADFITYKSSWRGRETERTRSESAALAAAEQEARRRFRALSLVIKAKLEAVASSITSFEEEFLAHIVLPGGKTVYEQTRDQVKIAYESQKPTDLLLGFGGGK